MRILMLNNEFPPLGGGTGVVNRHILEHWAAIKDVEVDLITSVPLGGPLDVESPTSSLRIHRVPVNNHNLHHSRNRELLLYAWRGWRHARRLLECVPYNACLAWAGVPAGGIAMWLHWEFKLPYIVSLQGADVPGFDRRYRWLYPALTPFIRLVWRSASAVVACSQHIRELAGQTDPSVSAEVIPNAVNPALFYPRVDPRPANAPVRLICTGRLVERKGQQYLIPAMAELKRQGLPIELLLVGVGDNEARLRSQVRELALQETVHFAGYVNWLEMPELYRSSDVFVLPSHNEGMSIALLEAMASGLPVVVTDTGTARQIVRENGLIVPWGDVDQLAQALGALVNSADLRARMARASQELARQYRWHPVAERYLELCRQVGHHGGEP